MPYEQWFQTLTDALKYHSEKQSENGIRFINGDDKEDFCSYNELYEKALYILNYLQEKGITRGNELILQIEESEKFIPIFWACLLGGIIPVPISVGHNDEHKEKLFRIWQTLNHPFIVTNEKNEQSLKAFAEARQYSIIDEITARTLMIKECFQSTKHGKEYPLSPNDIAFVQFSSGSTGDPKGVTLTHANLLTNIYQIIEGGKFTKADSVLSWMPLTHDMGIIGTHMVPLVLNIHQYLMPTAIFIRRPALWLKKINEHQVTTTSSPNFGYKYFLTNFKHRLAKDWELSHVRLFLNGAEPISPELCHQFLKRMEPYGLKRNVMLPVYGLAEASLAVTFSSIEESFTTIQLDRNYVSLGERVRETTTDNEDAVSFVEVGYPLNGCHVRICDDKNALLEDYRVGYIQIKGENVTKGYYNNQEVSERVIQEGWLNTGDLGFMKNGCLVITGRAKDIIFVNGQNFYPHDIERVSEDLQEIELGYIAACGVANPQTKNDDILLFVLFKKKVEDFALIAKKLKNYIRKKMGLEIHSVIPIRKMPKTTSGKIERYKLGEMYRQGKFDNVREEVNRFLEITVKNPADPKNEIESQLADICSKILGVNDVGIHDDFFELGGDSLKAQQFINAIENSFAIEVTISQLFINSSISKVSQLIIEQQNKEEIFLETIELKHIEDKRAFYPATSAQKRLYVIQQMNLQDVTYNESAALKIEGLLELQKLEQSMQVVIRRHESLRTTFEMHDGELVQKISEAVDFKLEKVVMDESELAMFINEFKQPFDLSRGPLFRGCIVTLSKGGYVLLLDAHHIIVDGTSHRIFMKELFDLYSGNTLPQVDIHFKDYALYQERLEQSPRLQKEENYWMNLYSGELPILQLPTDFLRRNILNLEGDRVVIKVNEEWTTKLKQMAFNHSSTLYMSLLATYNILLSKYTNQHDLIVGSPIAARLDAKLEHVIGMFVNTLALRNTIDDSKSFSEFLASVKENVLGAFEHQNYPYENMLNKLEIQRDLSRNPLFDTVFVLQNMEKPELNVENLIIEQMPIPNRTSKFDLTVESVEIEGELSFTFEYSTKLFKKETIERLSKHFIDILKTVTQFPNILVSDIDIVGKEESQTLLHTFNESETDFPKERTLQELFEEQVQLRPEHIAVKLCENQVTYRELNKRSNQLARYLRMKGVEPNQIVGMIVERSVEMIIGIISTLKAGGAYLPIDPEYPDSRVKDILTDSGTSWVLTSTSLAKKFELILKETSIQIITLDQLEPMIAEMDSSNLNIINKSSDLAHVMYTSGSTGKPKGNLITHSNVGRTVKNTNYLEVTAEDIILQVSNYAFDGSTFDIHGALLNGAELVLINKTTILDMRKLSNVIKGEKVTKLLITTALFNTLVDININCFEHVKKILFGGERVSIKHVRKALDFLGENKLMHMYGPAESTVFATYYVVNNIDEDALTIPIGKPISNTQIYILNKHNHLQPIGVAGELCISGEGVAKGYLNRLELTAEKFVPNPFFPNQVMYRTGDLARWLPDGNIEFIDRIDSQVKIRGFRIEIGEIEAQILNHRHVKEAVVLVKEAESGNKFLCAYVVGDDGLSITELKAELAKSLPDFMIPTAFVELEKMAITLNGKVDKKSLPEPSHVLSKNDYVEATNAVEKKLVEIWREILGIRTIGIHDNFFDLGGNSLLLVRMHSVIESVYEGKVEVPDLFTYTTIAELSVFIEKGQDKQTEFQFPFVNLPHDYFNEQNSISEDTLFTIQFTEHLVKNVIEMSLILKVEVIDILLTIYFYLLSTLSEEQELAVQTMLTNDNHAYSLNVNMSVSKDITSLIHHVNQSRKERNQANVYSIDVINKAKLNKRNKEILPLFCTEDVLREQEYLLDVYDMVVATVESSSKLGFIVQFNGKRMQKDKVRNLANGYMKLIELLVNDFIENTKEVLR
ncbi:non-ribosomal peptide synthetase [Halalkalibacter urbisdiaboli]|uniref:non-ribosomal peptide synthetase n=1 Tax=Halalkalibacter urbisdiaboli TaxID=1960589 RepID=UPI0013FDB8F2|nr:non-ribosomal peptide synthetase [Halalkalibacter urbisdiaboli]